jgi:NAD(P)H-nitrite reductase large subunit
MRYVIVGASAAGVSAAETFRQRDPAAETVVISDERLVYSRPLLSYYLAGHLSEENLLYRPRDFFEREGISLVLDRAKALDLAKAQVEVEHGPPVPYDKLLLATGASARFPRAEGIRRDGVFGLRHLSDVEGILPRLAEVKKAVVLGAGLVGLKAAAGLREHGVEVTMLVSSRHVLSQMLDASSALVFQDLFEQNGVRTVTGVKPTAILGNGRIEGVATASGEVFPCQLVMVGKGVDPNLELTQGTPIRVNYGVVVDQYLATSVENVYAAGDVVEAMDMVRGEPWINALWPCAVEQGRLAALNMLGEKVPYRGSTRMNSVQFFRLPVISAGLAVLTPGPLGGRSGEHDSTIEDRPSPNVYWKVFLKDDTIVGFVVMGDIQRAGLLKILMEKRLNVSDIRDDLLAPRLDLGFLLPFIAENRERFVEPEMQELVETVGV